jgi:hypothetical protein
MSLTRSCQAISAKCSIIPLVDNFMEERRTSNGKKLGRLGPCVFREVDDFFQNVLRSVKQENRIKTPIPVSNGQEVVGIGDIHGDLLVVLGTLYLMGLINLYQDPESGRWKGGSWKGGNTIVVQCGDLLDRSGRSASVMTDNIREEVDIVQYLYYLNLQARKSGGGVYWVLGNHDIARVWWKNYQGDEIEVEDPDETLRRRRISPDYRKYIGNQAIGWGGEEKMKELFQPGGLMAVYMATHASFTLQVGYYVFMHGGLTIPLLDKIYRQLNVRHPRYFFGMVNANVVNSFLKGDPINPSVKAMAWNRTWSEEKKLKDDEKWEDKKWAITIGKGSIMADKYCTANMKEIFRAVDMDWNKGAFVLGHSIQKDGVPLYCKGRVWRIDIGMSEAFSSGKIPKLIGGIKIFMHPESVELPVEVMVVINYSTGRGEGADYTDKFLLYVNRKFRKILFDNSDTTKIIAHWKRGVLEAIDKERRIQRDRLEMGVEKRGRVRKGLELTQSSTVRLKK